MTTAMDPVCGMSVDTEQAAARVEHEGTMYYFCSEQCHHMFIAQPQQYIAKEQDSGGHGGHLHGDD